MRKVVGRGREVLRKRQWIEEEETREKRRESSNLTVPHLAG